MADGENAEVDELRLIRVTRGQILGRIDAAVGDENLFHTGADQRITDGVSGAAGTQQQHGLALRLQAAGTQAVHKSPAVSVIADGTAVFDADGVHRAAGGCRGAQLIQQRQDGLLVGHGDVEPGTAAGLGLGHEVGQIAGLNAADFIGVVYAGLGDHGAVEQRRKAMIHGVADKIELFVGHTSASPVQPQVGAAAVLLVCWSR